MKKKNKSGEFNFASCKAKNKKIPSALVAICTMHCDAKQQKWLIYKWHFVFYNFRNSISFHIIALGNITFRADIPVK